MPRESSEARAALSVVPDTMPERPDPPAELTKEEAEIWRSIVAALPPDWFRPETEPILVELCQHVSMSGLIVQQMAAFKTKTNWTPKDAKAMFNLIKMKSVESRLIASLSKSLRLTADAKHKTGKRAKRNLESRKPWDLPDDEE